MEKTVSLIGTSEIHRYISVIWKRKVPILVFLVIFVSASVVATVFFSTPKYEASVEMLLKSSGIDKALIGTDLFQEAGSQPERNAQNAVELVKSQEVSSKVNEELEDSLNGKDSSGFIDVNIIKNADIIRITATYTNPQTAADIANSYSEAYIEWRQEVDNEVIAEAMAPLESQIESTPEEQRDSTSYRVLEDKLETLKIIEALQIGNIEITKTASAAIDPISPKPIRIGYLSLFAGLVLSIGFVLVREQLDTSLKNIEDITSKIDKPVLATIPRLPKSTNSSPVSIVDPSSPSSEAFRMLKTNLSYLEPDREIKTILITSPGPGEGKSTTVTNLAITLARAGQKVIILEADLRKPALSSQLNLSDHVGLSNVLSGNCTFREALQMIEPKDIAITSSKSGSERSTIASLSGIKPILCATTGPIPPNPGEMAASEKMGLIIKEAGRLADMVLIDAPPLGLVGDAASIAASVDGVLLVVRMSQTSKKSLGLIQAFQSSVPSDVLGVVVTDSDLGGPDYGYGGYYS